MTDLRDIPAIRKLAEERARDIWTANVKYFQAAGWDITIDPGEAPTGFGLTIEAQIDLLSDLSRPDSRDAVARLVAAKVGIECGATAPDFARFVCGEHCCDGERGRMVPCSRPIWSMMGADETQMVTFADCPDPDEWGGDERRHVPGISAITDPAEALRLIALAVLSEKA